MWILVLSILSFRGSSETVALTTQEMSSYKTCASAGETFIKQHKPSSDYGVAKWSCVKK